MRGCFSLLPLERYFEYSPINHSSFHFLRHLSDALHRVVAEGGAITSPHDLAPFFAHLTSKSCFLYLYRTVITASLFQPATGLTAACHEHEWTSSGGEASVSQTNSYGKAAATFAFTCKAPAFGIKAYHIKRFKRYSGTWFKIFLWLGIALLGRLKECLM